MKHSVVIPLYNKEAYIFDTIRSLANQLKKPDQIIIVDDCSTDQSVAKLKEALSFFTPYFFATRIQIIEMNENKGPGSVRNIGMERATGDIISFLDADDCYLPACLSDVSEIMEQEQIDVLVLGLELVPHKCCLPEIESFQNELTALSDELFLIPNFLHAISAPDFIMGVGSNVAIRRKHLKNIRYDTAASLNEGIDFWYRILKDLPQHAKVALLNKTCINVRQVEGSLSRIAYTSWKQLEIPPTIKRYRRSSDTFDNYLTGMLSQRWFEHAMERLPSWKQKTLFVLNHFQLLIKSRYYLIKRNLIL